MRLDVWLDVSCLYRTRSEAQKACKGGKVDVNGQTGRPHRDLKLEDVIEISRPHGRRQKLVVRGLAEKHIAKVEARKLYDDVTAPPSREEADMIRMTRLARPFFRPVSAGSPDKRERRELRRIKQGESR